MTARSRSMEKNLQTCLEMVEKDAESLEAVLARFPDEAAELRLGLDAAAWLHQQRTALNPPPGFIQDSRRRLVKEIGDQTAVLSWRRMSGPLRMAFQVVFLTLLVLVSFAVGRLAVLSSQASLPGDGLYPVKRLWEETCLATTLDKGERAVLLVFSARERATEIQELVMEGRYTDIRSSIGPYEDQILRASRSLEEIQEINPVLESDLEGQLSEALKSQTVVLSALLGGVPENYRPGVQQVMLVQLH